MRSDEIIHASFTDATPYGHVTVAVSVSDITDASEIDMIEACEKAYPILLDKAELALLRIQNHHARKPFDIRASTLHYKAPEAARMTLIGKAGDLQNFNFVIELTEGLEEAYTDKVEAVDLEDAEFRARFKMALETIYANENYGTVSDIDLIFQEMRTFRMVELEGRPTVQEVIAALSEMREAAVTGTLTQEMIAKADDILRAHGELPEQSSLVLSSQEPQQDNDKDLRAPSLW